jgi:hypothetical protein
MESVMGKKHKGNHPDLENGWEKIGEWLDKGGDGVRWSIFRRRQEHSDEWMTYKICANGKAESKANYWAVRKNTGQLGFIKDMAIMRAHRPELHAAVEEIMEADG